MADDDKSPLTRRRVLGGMATIGAAGAVGAGTTALFTDQEMTDVSLAAGELDLQVDYEYTYRGGANNTSTDSGMLQETSSGDNVFVCDLTDIKPGDSLTIKFCPEVFTNQGYVQLTGSFNSGSGSDLASELNVVSVKMTDGNTTSSLASDIALANAIGHLNNSGYILDGDLSDSGTNPYPSGGDRGESNIGDEEGPCIEVVIELPESTGNSVQGDSLSFELVFNAEQARHNENPFGEDNPQ